MANAIEQQIAPSPASTARPRLSDFLELVKFGHTVFALPFALASMLVAAHGLPALRVVGWIVVAMVAARTAAMGFNRIVDREIDARNPRTAAREIPSGRVSVAQAATLVLASSVLFGLAAWQLNRLSFLLAAPTLGLLFFYSYCKRFTSAAHLVLGLCLGVAPIGAWIAVRQRLDWPPLALGAAVMLWVAGFDVIYATMDEQFDRGAGLHSLVLRLGVPRALMAARVLHIGFLGLLSLFGALALPGTAFPLAVAAIGLFLAYEHHLVDPRDLRRVNAAFFTVNGVISIFFLLVVGLLTLPAGR